MINNIWFKIIAGKINKIPEFYTIFARKMPEYIIRRDRGQAEAKTSRPGRGQSFEAEAKIWPRGLNITAIWLFSQLMTALHLCVLYCIEILKKA